MESNRKEEASSNIPHMHLFMFLKRRFPNLKDADITDSIQRFGLDKTRCEVELTRRSQEQHRSYYSWNRSRTNSRGSSTGQNSPLSPSETHSQVSSPLQNGTTLPSPLSGQTKIAMNPTFSPDANRNLAEQFIDVGISAISSPPSGGTRVVYSGASCSQVSTTCSGNTSVKCSSPPLHHIGFIADASNGFLNDLKGEPNSAPVIPESREPVFDPVLAHHRRSSADTAKEHYKKQSPSTAYPSPPPRKYSSPSSLTKTTTSPPSTSCPSTTATSFSNSPTHGQGKNQSPHRPAQAAIQEQLARKERLKEELDQRIEDKTRLKNEIKGLSEKLDSKEKSQRLEVIRSKKEIELIQQDNSKLQFVCDEMERLILESGESPKTDQEGRLLNDLTSPTFQDSSRIHALPPLHSAGSNTSLSSGGRPMTPTPSLIPSRKAPSPPISAAVSPPTTSQNFRTSGNEEGGKGWSCSKCTFLNNPYLNECEICSFPHFSSGTPHLPNQNPSSAAPNSGGPCYCHHRHHYNLSHEHTSTGELQDIHIQVRHQNLHSPTEKL